MKKLQNYAKFEIVGVNSEANGVLKMGVSIDFSFARLKDLRFML